MRPIGQHFDYRLRMHPPPEDNPEPGDILVRTFKNASFAIYRVLVATPSPQGKALYCRCVVIDVDEVASDDVWWSIIP